MKASEDGGDRVDARDDEGPHPSAAGGTPGHRQNERGEERTMQSYRNTHSGLERDLNDGMKKTFASYKCSARIRSDLSQDSKFKCFAHRFHYDSFFGPRTVQERVTLTMSGVSMEKK